MLVNRSDPRAATSRILVAVGDQYLRERAFQSVRGLADEIEDIPTLGHASTNLRASRERLAVIVGRTTRSGPANPASIEALRARAPLTHVVLCTTWREVSTVQLAAFARAGVDCISFLGDALGERELRAQLAERLKHTLPPDVATHQELGATPFLHTDFFAAEVWCARNGYRPLRVDYVADHFGVNRKTLYRKARDAGWRDLQTVLNCARLLHIAAALWCTAAPVERISRQLRFGSAGALHKLVKRYTGLTPIQLRQTDALGLATACWRGRGRSPICGSLEEKDPVDVVNRAAG